MKSQLYTDRPGYCCHAHSEMKHQASRVSCKHILNEIKPMMRLKTTKSSSHVKRTYRTAHVHHNEGACHPGFGHGWSSMSQRNRVYNIFQFSQKLQVHVSISRRSINV